MTSSSVSSGGGGGLGERGWGVGGGGERQSCRKVLVYGSIRGKRLQAYEYHRLCLFLSFNCPWLHARYNYVT